MGSIIINHKEGIISSNDDVIVLGDKSSIKLGTGTYLDDSATNDLSKYEGAIRYNSSSKTMEYCDGENWKEFILLKKDIDTDILWSLLF